MENAPSGIGRRKPPEAPLLTVSVRPRWILQVTGTLLISAGLLYGGAWLGSRGHTQDPGAAAANAPTRLFRWDRETSATLLKELIAREASLGRPGLTQWDTVNRIREWAHANIDLATPSSLLDQDPSFNFFNKSTPEIFAAFFNDRGGVWCGGAAYALMELYKLFGFRASLIDFGKPDVMTHVVTLVTIDFGGRPRTVIQDATLNLTYVTRDARPYDYLQLLAALMHHQHRKIRILPGGGGGGDALVDPRDADFPFDHVVDFSAPPTQVLQNGIKKYRSRLSWRSFERKFGPRIRSFLREEGHPEDLLYLFLYPLAGSDPSVLGEARRLTRRQ